MITPVAVSKTCSCGAKSGSCYKEGHSHSYNCPSGYSATNSWGGLAQTASKTCSCGEASGTCYKAPEHSHSYSCPSGYSTSCSKGYTATTSKVCSCGAISGICYKCKVTCGPCQDSNNNCAPVFNCCPGTSSICMCGNNYGGRKHSWHYCTDDLGTRLPNSL